MPFQIASPIPTVTEPQLSSHCRNLAPSARDALANHVWVTMHINHGHDKYKLPHSDAVIEEFATELNKAARAQQIIASAQPSNVDKSPTAVLSPIFVPAPSAPTPAISAPAVTPALTPSQQPTPSSTDYSALVPVRTASSAIGAHALRPEIKEHLLSRAGYVPLSVLINPSILYMADNPGALKVEHKPARKASGELEKRWIPVLTDFLASELKLARSEWSEAWKNMLELFQ